MLFLLWKQYIIENQSEFTITRDSTDPDLLSLNILADQSHRAQTL